MSKNTELIGVWLGAKQVFDNGVDRRCVIGDIRMLDGKSQSTIKGYASEEELSTGVTYRFFGFVRTHPKWGPQFNFSSFCEEVPVDEDSVIAYLQTCRSVERGSITRRVAFALFEKFGVQAIDRLIEDPVGCSQSIKQWGPEKAGLASQYLSANAGLQRCKLDLIAILNGRGFPKKTMDRAIKEWGARAAQIIKASPYKLMDLPGIGFKSADKMYCDLARETSKSPEEYQDKLSAMERQGLCAAYEVSQESRKSGSTWIPVGMAKAAVIRSVSHVRALPDDAIQWGVNEGRLVVRDGFVSTFRNSLHELEIAEFITNSDDGVDWPEIQSIADHAPDDKPLSEHQLAAINAALQSRVCCLQGSPGVGKTFSVACIVKALITQFGGGAIGVAAPTGKAAVRMTQSLADNDVTLAASTIHRMLGVVGQSGGEGWSFHYNEQNPLPYRFLVLDECSMCDVDLMASLIRACSKSTHILFVGDSNQLAPVGHGRPFFDLQRCVPTGHLTEIRRNSGRIVRACAEIRDFNRITYSPQLALPDENMPLIQCEPTDQVQILESLILKFQNGDDWGTDIDPIEDVQIVTAKNDGSLVARKPVNTVLQSMLNPHGMRMKGNPFRVNDKIVCLKNGYYQDIDDPKEQQFVANGELGRVLSIAYGRMEVRLSDPVRSIAVIHAPIQDNETEIADSEDMQRGAVGDWDLGYCLSVHRSQGSQWPYVIVLIDNAGHMVQTRNWIYTAISRAQIATFIVGQSKVVDIMMRKDGISGRKTFLVERIERERLARTINYDELMTEV